MAVVLVAAGIVVIVASAVLFGGFRKVPQGFIGVSYGAGPFESNHYQATKLPGDGRFFNGVADQFFLYPSTQRNYIVSETAGEGDVRGEDHVIVASSDSIPVTYQFAVYFKLNTHPDVLRRFHEQIGLKYQAWDLSEEGGWDRMLLDNFRQPIEATLQREGRQYTAADLYTKAETLDRLSQDVGSQLKESINSKLGGEYFCGPSFSQVGNECPDFGFAFKPIKLPQPVIDSFISNRTSQIAVQTEANKVEQAKQQALAIREVSKALAQAGPNYALLQAVQSGKVQFWVVPQGSNLTLQTPPPSPGG
jgi:regulator of protease activity HflC (stomatin/prohibitin superfamily)